MKTIILAMDKRTLLNKDHVNETMLLKSIMLLTAHLYLYLEVMLQNLMKY